MTQRMGIKHFSIVIYNMNPVACRIMLSAIDMKIGFLSLVLKHKLLFSQLGFFCSPTYDIVVYEYLALIDMRS